MTTAFSDLLTDVYTMTNRPDLVTETTLAVKQATLKAHNSDYFPRDIYETGVDFGAAAYYQQLDYMSLLPRWRALKYVRKYDAVNSSAGKFLDIITPEQLMDGYGVEKTDLCYQAGAYINIKTSDQVEFFLLGAYLNPILDVTTYNSWIANNQREAITVPAAAAIFKMIGFDEQNAVYNQLANDQYALLKTSYLLAQGY